MTTTRRKAKAAAEQDTEDSEVSQTLNFALPEDVDQETLSAIMPDTDFTTISPDDVVALFRLVVSQEQALNGVERERDDARAELDRKEIELDQVLQDREGSSKEAESQLEAVQDEFKRVKDERDQLAAAKSALQAQLTNLSASQNTTSSEVDALRRRVDDTEREKRDLLGIISRLKDEAVQRDEEVHTLRVNLKEARQEHQTLESQVRELKSAETATKFRVDSLEQQLQLAQGEAERANNDLTAKTEEFARYRRTKLAEIATLQSSFDSVTQSSTSSEASLKALQSAHTSQGHQLTQALAKVQDLTGQLAEQEARYSNEVSGLKRLVSMMEERENQAKEIVENVEREWATVGERAERRESSLRDEADRERRARQEAEKRLEQMEKVVDKMGRGELPLPGRGLTSTPIRGSGSPDISVEGMMGLSPTVAMASKVQRAGKTFTEVYADYIRLEEELVQKTGECEHMDRTLSAVLAQIQERAPVLSQQRQEYDRLQAEAAQLGSQLSQALSERDTQAATAQDASQKLTKANIENTFLQKQLEDMGRQIQHLLRQVARHDDPTIPSDEELDGLPAEPAPDTETLISDHLVLFRNINVMQIQNQRLLKIVRELGFRMESEEREYREVMEREQAEAIKEAHGAMQELASQLERQKESSDKIIKAYVKERDALRELLGRAQREGGAVASSAVEGATSGVSSDLASELAEVQGQFDAYKLEMGIDAGRLRDELIAAQREVNTMSAALAKANAKVDYLSDRQRMHEEQFRVHHLEIDELTKRNAQLTEQNVRLDIEYGRAADELEVAGSRLEQLRNDCANLRAEKKIWEGIQGRLVEENRTLGMERSHLSDLMSNVQKMHHDLERSGENDRRRLEGQLQMLEGQTQDLRTQLLQERESIRHLTLQKDLELKDLQARIEKNTAEFSKTRESLVEAQTSKKHLEEKVEDLIRQLKGNEEKLAVYERRPGASSQPAEQDLSREQQLENEVAELRSALKVTEVDLAAAKSHRDQYQEISQANEAALAALNNTFDEYKASTEVSIARHESEVKSLQQRLEQANTELTSLRSQVNESQKAFEVERTAWINDKKVLEDTIVDLSTSEKHSESDRSSKEQDFKSLEDRATSAEQRYSQEIIAHAESMKSLDILKKELAAAHATTREQRTAAQTAQAKLASSEGSWKLQKDALEKEVSDLNTRCQELSQQNSTLHQHLETVSAQATRIRNAAEAPADGSNEGDSPLSEDVDSRLSELRSVVSYLRKEKGIVDLQLEMAKRESSVQKSQIERLSQSLQEARNSLTEERERALQNSSSASQHSELVERINQLNILRESNATLRADCDSANRKARELETRLQQLSSDLDPAREQARSATAELESTKAQMQRLEQESRRWQERNAQLLTKYDRVDPAEVQSLRDEITQLKQDATSAQEKLTEKESAVEVSNKRVESLENIVRNHKEVGLKNLNTFKAKMGAFAAERKQFEEKITNLEQEILSLKTAQTSMPIDATLAPAQTEEIEKQKALIASLQAERDKLASEKEALSKLQVSAPESTHAAPDGWEAEKAELVKSRDDAVEKLKSAEANFLKASTEVRNIKFQNDKFQARIQDMMKAKAVEAEKQAHILSDAVEKAKSDATSAPDSSVTEELTKRHSEELKALGDRLKAEHELALKAAVEEATKSQTGPSVPPTDDQQAAINAAIAEYEKKAQAHLEKEVTLALDRGRNESGIKAKIKDSQLLKAQNRVKELEAQIHGWQAAGIDLPPPTPLARTNGAAPSPTTPAPTPTAPRPTPSTPAKPTTAQTAAAGPSQPKPSPAPAAPNAAGTPNAASLPRKPGVPGAPVPTAPGASLATRGGAVMRGRGAVPARGAPLRGGVPGRGAAPLRQPPVKPATSSPLSGGVSIMGAAGKRPREENGSTTEDSLAKRLKPADAP